ncbi:MAG: hypothetical protein Q4F72_03430 [Desulfovibrionaceae bacterium]|nr:hypothetical protein [Desulfovibrionaceae bacterium]
MPFPHATARAACAALAALMLAGPALPGPACAAPKEYGPQYQRYVIDVPEGWSENVREQGDGALTLTSPDGKSSLSVRLCPREGRRVEALARRAATNLSVSSWRRQEEDVWVLYVTSENVRVRNIIRPMGEAVMVISVSGENERTQAMIASLQPGPGA